MRITILAVSMKKAMSRRDYILWERREGEARQKRVI